ncbi:MAG: exosortase F system-associated protein [Ichthyobacteriaceae bacterium]|nr:exosortase F system-associated protein [Ichthyobacteriaceae bacterium]
MKIFNSVIVTKVLLISVLFFALILVRVLQNQIFYDPFILYFKGGYLRNSTLPEFSMFKMIINLILRYTINATISISIIYVWFKDVSFVKFSAIFYLVILFILLLLYVYYISINFSSGYLSAFYVRRFLIQPLFLFLLVPAFIYQNKNNL